MDLLEATQKYAICNPEDDAPKASKRPRSETSGSQRAIPVPSPLDGNSALLKSPGPLESMLKTTTETGDIGLFSIKHIPASATYHHSARPRPMLMDVNLLPPARVWSPEDPFLRDDRKQLPSHRDTASEILSLYGSEYQAPLSRSFSPFQDDGRRSYSLTTCSSRYIPSQKSSGTLQSQSSTSALQRPRSPFPYPTRLKRPGVRPASPALTDQGEVDYSRMVGLDRTSQRTIHGSYKSTLGYATRRAPPLSLRPEHCRSSTSLSSQPSHGLHSYDAGHHHSRMQNPGSRHLSRPSDVRCRVSNDQSLRSASLTSIIEMYNKPFATPRAANLRESAGSLYYDYSEEFANDPPQDFTVAACPTPEKANAFREPFVLKNDAQKQAAVERLVADRACLPDHDHPGPQTSLDAGNASQATEAQTTRLVRFSGEDGAGKSEQKRVGGRRIEEDSPGSSLPGSEDHYHTVTPLMDNEPPKTLCSDNIEDAESNLTEQPLDSKHDYNTGQVKDSFASCQGTDNYENAPPSPGQASQSSLARFRCTLDPALSEFGVLLTSFDRLARMQFGHGTEDKRRTESAKGKDSAKMPKAGSNCPSGNVGKRLAEGRAIGTGEMKRFRKRHRRNPAALTITALGDVGQADSGVKLPNDSTDVPIIAPEPISPAHELNLKNSIPQLMKALPPLPPEAYKARGCTRETDGNTQGTVKDTMRSPHDSNELPASPRSELATGQLRSKTSYPKFKIRVNPSKQCPASPESLNSASGAVKTRLKLKIPQTDTNLGGDGGQGAASGSRSTCLKQCNSLVDHYHCVRKENQGDQPCKQGAAMYRASPIAKAPKIPSVHSTRSASDSAHSTQPSDPFSITYPPSVWKPGEDDRKASRSATLSQAASLREACSMSYQPTKQAQRGLRHKLSMLRLRLIGSQRHEKSKAGEQAPLFDAGGSLDSSADSRRIYGTLPADMGRDRELATSHQSDKNGGRVKRWASSARRAVHNYVIYIFPASRKTSKRLDRPVEP